VVHVSNATRVPFQVLATTMNKRVAEIMIKRSIPVDLWNQKKECSKGKDRAATELNHYINTVRAKILQIHRELKIDNKTITADIIKL
jgi:hypothetical protein